MAITAVSEIRVFADAEGDVLAGLRESLPHSRGRQGCLSIDLYRVVGERLRFVLISKWATIDDYKSYVRWQQNTGRAGTLHGSLVEGPSVRVLEGVSV